MTAFTQIEGGGVTSALGFKAAGVHAGFRKESERRDLALVVADETGAPVSASDLPAAGGWGVLDPRAAFARRYGAFDVSVVFDGEAALSARLVRPNLGTLLFIR